MKKHSTVVATLIAGLMITSSALAFQTTSTPPPGTTTPSKSTKSNSKAATEPAGGTSQTTASQPKSQAAAKPVVPNATPAQIADAKAKGLVWVNTSSKVYHKSDDKYYGATKHGQFMTEADAQKAGAHLAK
jgi:hypothetical protein